MSAPSSLPPPWQGKWPRPHNIEGYVRILCHDDMLDKPVEFFVVRNTLVASCEYFAAALSGEWAEGAGKEHTLAVTPLPASATSELETACQGLALDDRLGTQKPETESVAASEAIPKISFEEGPQTVHDMLTYIHVPASLELMPDTVEALLGLACMIGLAGLMKKCEEYLEDKVSWDPVGTLALAEHHRLKELYKAAAEAVMRQYDRRKTECSLKLSETTQMKLKRHRRIYHQQVAMIAALDILGRMENCCSVCERQKSSKLSAQKNTLRAALDPDIWSYGLSSLASATRHRDECDLTGKVTAFNRNGITLLGAEKPVLFVHDGSAPEEMLELLVWAARKVSAGSNENVEAQIAFLLKGIAEDEHRRFY